MKSAFPVLTLLLSFLPVLGQGQLQKAPPAETVAPDIPGVVAGGAKVQLIKYGLQGADGPLALPDGSLLFWERDARRINKIGIDGNISPFLEHIDGSNALAFDSKRRLISVRRMPEPTAITVIYPKGSETVLADHFEGKLFSRTNDMVADKKGGIYFTDSGSLPQPGVPPPPLPPSVYYISPGGKLMHIAEVKFPNGLQLSPDEKTLYVNDSHAEYMVAFDIRADGTARNRRNFARYASDLNRTAHGSGNLGEADGLAVDGQGRIYSANPEGIEVFSPQGRYLGTIPLSTSAQNLAFAGPEKKTLYLVGGGIVWKIQMLAQGLKNRAK